MGDLAQTYSALGRHDDALAMKERVLEFRRRVLPENHPHIGEGDVWYWIACTRFSDCDAWVLFDVQAWPWGILPRRTLPLEGTTMRLR